MTSLPSESSTALDRFRADVSRHPRLDRDEEHELAVRAAAGERRARDRLVAANTRHVLAIARHYRRYGIATEDLVSEGNIGLCIAATKFEPERGIRFVTYAGHWIRARMIDAILRDRTLVGGGAGVFRSKVFFRLHRERARLEATCADRSERIRLLATHFGRTEEQIVEMLGRLDARDVSLDAPFHDGDGESRLDSLAALDPGADEALGAQRISTDLAQDVHRALGRLDPRERRIVDSRALADDEIPLAELAREFGVSRERARQIEARAHGKLRKELARFEDAA